MVGSALCGWKVVRLQVGSELGSEDTCEADEVAGEGRALPAPGVVMKAEPIFVVRQWLKTDDGLLVDIDVEQAPVGPHGDVRSEERRVGKECRL